MMIRIKWSLMLLVFVLVCTRPYCQSLLIEEFTNLNAPDYSLTHDYLDSTLIDIPDICIIKYHTDFPSEDVFSNTSVNIRYEKIAQGLSFPSAIIDGKVVVDGDFPEGSPLNIKSDDVNDLFSTKEDKINFFGSGLSFSDDLQELYATEGFTAGVGISTFGVKLYMVLVEKMVETENPIGPNGEQVFTYVFRSFIEYADSQTAFDNGSFHVWNRWPMPASVKDVNNLRVVNFIEDLEGNVVDCNVVVPEMEVQSYSVDVINVSLLQLNYCQNKSIPRVQVKNTGQSTVTGLSLDVIVDSDTTQMVVMEDILPGETGMFVFDSITLPPGRHFIDMDVDYVIDAPATAIINKLNGQKRFLVSGDLDLIDEDFEGLSDDPFDIGGFMVRTQTDLAFKKVTAADLDHSELVGGYGESETCLMVDQWNWDWDEEDAGIVFNQDNKNFAFLLYNNFDLSSVKFPALYFDVAAATNSNHKCLRLGIGGSCTNNFSDIITFNCNDLNTAPSNTSSLFIPDSTQWQTKRVSLYSRDELDDIQLRFWTSNHVDFTYPNAFYLDNIKIVSEAKECITESLPLETQAEVDAYVESMEKCNYIVGDLCIGDCDGDGVKSDIHDLSGLSTLIEIEGNLTITGTESLKSLSGLNSLRAIMGSLTITENDSLLTLGDLSTSRGVDAGIYIVDNPQLTTMFNSGASVVNGDFIITGNAIESISLTQYEAIYGDLILHDFATATRLGGLSNLVYVGGKVEIVNFPFLQSLSGIRELEEINGDLVFKNIGLLRYLGLFQLSKVNGNLSISNTDSLIACDIFRLDSIRGNVVFENNKNLTNIEDLNDIDYNYLNSEGQHSEYLIFRDNTKLSTCDINIVCNHLADDNRNITIENNGDGCLDIEQVSMLCLPTSLDDYAVESIHVYPNPTSGRLHLENPLTRKLEFSVSDIYGKTLKVIESEGVIDLSKYIDGVYILRIKDVMSESIISKKILLMK